MPYGRAGDVRDLWGSVDDDVVVVLRQIGHVPVQGRLGQADDRDERGPVPVRVPWIEGRTTRRRGPNSALVLQCDQARPLRKASISSKKRSQASSLSVKR